MIHREYFAINVIHAPLATVVSAFDAYPSMRVRSVRTDLKLLDDDHSRQPILWSPRSSPELTAFLPSSAGYVIEFSTTTFKFDVLSIRSTSRIHDDSINELLYFSNGSLSRAVRVMKDPGWTYWEEGPPLPFEDTGRYKLKILPKRLDRQLLLTYLEAFGANVTSDDFWLTDTLAATFTLKDEWAARATEKPIPCPYCGKLLRTARAKQCQHCFRSWHVAEG